MQSLARKLYIQAICVAKKEYGIKLDKINASNSDQKEKLKESARELCTNKELKAWSIYQRQKDLPEQKIKDGLPIAIIRLADGSGKLLHVDSKGFIIGTTNQIIRATEYFKNGTTPVRHIHLEEILKAPAKIFWRWKNGQQRVRLKTTEFIPEPYSMRKM